MLTDKDCFHEQILTAMRFKIVNGINPRDILDEMADKTSTSDRQRIQQKCIYSGNIDGARELVDVLYRAYSDAFVQFVKAVYYTVPGKRGVCLAKQLIANVPDCHRHTVSDIISLLEVNNDDLASAGIPINSDSLVRRRRWSQAILPRETFLKHLAMGTVEKIGRILNRNNAWEQLAGEVSFEQFQKIRGSREPFVELFTVFVDHGWTVDRFRKEAKTHLSEDIYQSVEGVGFEDNSEMSGLAVYDMASTSELSRWRRFKRRIWKPFRRTLRTCLQVPHIVHVQCTRRTSLPELATDSQQDYCAMLLMVISAFIAVLFVSLLGPDSART